MYVHLPPCRRGGHVAVGLGGELDAADGAALQALVDDVLAARADAAAAVHVNMSRVEFMDSTGLNFLVTLHKQVCGGGGRVVVEAPSAPVRRLLRLTHLEEILTVGPEAPAPVRPMASLATAPDERADAG